MDNSAQSSNPTTPATPDAAAQPMPTTPAEQPASQQAADPTPVTPPAPTQETPPPPPPVAPETPTPVPADPPADPKPEDPPATPSAPTPPPPATETPAPVAPPAPETPKAETPAPAAPTTPTDAKPMEKIESSASLSGSQTPPPPAQPQAKHFRISPWTLLLLIVLAGFAGFFIYVAMTPKVKNVPATQQSYAPTPTPVAQSALSLQPSQPSTQGAQLGTVSYDVVIDTGNNIANAVELELSYDPTVLKNVSVTPGTFFTTPEQLVKDIDTANGRISYALGIQPKDKGVKGTGVVAQIMFQFNPTATVSSTMIKFLPKTLVAAQGVNPSVLKSTTDATITVPGKTGTLKTTSAAPMIPATTGTIPTATVTPSGKL